MWGGVVRCKGFCDTFWNYLTCDIFLEISTMFQAFVLICLYYPHISVVKCWKIDFPEISDISTLYIYIYYCEWGSHLAETHKSKSVHHESSTWKCFETFHTSHQGTTGTTRWAPDEWSLVPTGPSSCFLQRSLFAKNHKSCTGPHKTTDLERRIFTYTYICTAKGRGVHTYTFTGSI